MTDLHITHLQVFPIAESSGKLKAFARVTLNDQLQLTSLRVYDGTNGLFVAYPNDTLYKGEDYKQLYYPVSKSFRDHMETKILEEYEHEMTEIK